MTISSSLPANQRFTEVSSANTVPSSPNIDFDQQLNAMRSPSSPASKGSMSDVPSAGFQGDGVLSNLGPDETLLSSVEIKAGRALLGVGARGGALNWAGIGLDVMSVSAGLVKLLRGETLQPSDKAVVSGYLEGSLREMKDNPAVNFISKLIGSQGLNFEAGVNVELMLQGDGKGGMRVEQIALATIAILPQRGKLDDSYRDFGGHGSVHKWKFPEEGGVEYSSSAQVRQGAFAVLNPKNKDNAMDIDVIPGTRGLVYGMIGRDVDQIEDLALALRQGTNFVPGSIPGSANAGSDNIAKIVDTAVAADFLIRLGNALVGGPNLSGDGKPEETTFRGWVRAIQAVEPTGFATPPDVPMVGMFIEANGYVKVIEDGDPTIKFFTNNSSKPLMEVSVQQLKDFYNRLERTLSDAIEGLTGIDISPEPASKPVKQAPVAGPPDPTPEQMALLHMGQMQRRTNAAVAAQVPDPSPPNRIGNAEAFRDVYSDANMQQALDAAQSFNATSTQNVALAYPVFDPKSDSWFVEYAAGQSEGRVAEGLTPSQARTLMFRLDQSSRLPDEVNNTDKIFLSNGIGGWTKPDGSTATPADDLIFRDANIYFSSLKPDAIAAALQKSAPEINGKQATVFPESAYNGLRGLTTAANPEENGVVSVAFKAQVNLPYESPVDSDAKLDAVSAKTVVYLYENLTPTEAIAAVNGAGAAGQLNKSGDEILRDNGLSPDGLRRREEKLRDQSEN